MSPTAKDLEVSNAGSNSAGMRPTPGADDANKPQPVPLEVPVTVNGARTVEGSDKREPFSESTQTVLVFANGAVIRLSSAVAAGQLLFLTNDKTKKEVVCQVVKSKNYRNVSGYVELEFTEPVAGFWGMRFPGERAAAPAGAPVAARPATSIVVPVAPAARKVEAPAATSVPQPQRVEPKPAPRPTAPVAQQPAAAAPTLPLSQVRPETLTASSLHVATKPVAPALNSAPQIVTSLPKAPGLTDGWESGMTSSAPPATTSKIPTATPQAPVAPKAPAPSVVAPSSQVAPPASQVSVKSQAATPDALRRETDKLHEQLASMLLGTEAPKTIPASPAPVAHKPLVQELSSKVVEIAKPQSHAQKFNTPAKSASESSLDQDEVKIPSWLEPLARNAASHPQNELIAKEDAAHNDRVIEFEVQDLSVPTTATKDEAAEADPVFETHFDGQSDLAAADAPKKSNKGILIGAIAAGLVLAVAGGTWYSRRSSAEPAQVAAATSSPETAPAAAAPAAPTPSANATQPPARSTDKATPNRSNINSEPVPVLQTQAALQQNSLPSTPSTQLVKGVDKNVSAELSAYKRLAEPANETVKKPSLGEVHLAAPKATRATGAVVGEAEALSLNSSEATPGGDAMNPGLGGGKQPVAPAVPLPVGGDVTPAHLIASTAPVYPALAKAQHIEGAVRVDALIEANGKISAMKIVSGPVLLHQAAMEALRQWKYQPATLDGKAVSMHLTVTIQFRLQ
jgi:TonB family protein